MATSLRQRRRQLLREEILAAAARTMGVRGYDAVSMDELAAEAGISKPTLYSQFPTKRELLAALAIIHLEELVAIVDGTASGRTPLELLVELVRMTLYHSTKGAASVQMLMPEIVTILLTHAETRPYIQRIDRAVAALVRAAIADGEIDPSLDQNAVVCALYSLTCAPSIGRATGNAPLDATSAPSTIAAIFREGVRRR